MTKIFLFTLSLLTFTSCVVSKKKYLVLEQELAQIKADLKDDDKDGVPNYLDLEQTTDSLAQVDTKGRTIKIVKIIDIDEDGILDVNDFCPTIKGNFSANGCPDMDGDGFYDFLDKCPRAAGIDSLDGCPIVRDACFYPIKISTIYGIRFIDKTTKYKEKSKKILDSLITQVSDVLFKNSSYLIEIKSFTDSLGDPLKNISLCEKRAELVKKLLVKKGITENRILIKAFGSQSPKHSNETKEGREANNRIEFNVIFKE